MANALYDTGRNLGLTTGLNWLTATIREVLVDLADYTPSLTTHAFLSDIPAIARVATSGPLTSKTAVAGVADAADPVFPGATGDQAEAVVGYVDTGNAATSQLIYYLDTVTGLPVTPNTGDINHVFDNGANRVFKL